MYPIAQTALEKVSARIAVSEAARQTLVEHMGGDAVLIPNGVDTSAFGTLPPLPGWPGDGGSLFFIGRIDEPRKGLQILLEALPAVIERHPGVRLLVAGPGDIEDFTSSLDASVREHVTFLGLVTEEEKIKWVLNYLRAMQQEMAELTDSVPWKWWAKYQKFDEQNAKVEVVDLFHFLVSLAQTLGMTADDVYQAYLKKNAVNHQRQETGYVKKDEADSKHI